MLHFHSCSSGRAGKPALKWTEVLLHFILLYCILVSWYLDLILFFALNTAYLTPVSVVILQVQSWFQNRQLDFQSKDNSLNGSNKSNPDARPLDKPNESTPTSKSTFVVIVFICAKLDSVIANVCSLRTSIDRKKPQFFSLLEKGDSTCQICFLVIS